MKHKEPIADALTMLERALKAADKIEQGLANTVYATAEEYQQRSLIDVSTGKVYTSPIIKVSSAGRKEAPNV